ncbi:MULTISPECIES: hypothetical protein [Streptomyces]|uniref:hypothetical protein n=1 Tax=Streptomyces TaxID=1883 RepID=UPI002E2D63DC|nr:hypothetical protein [Streptomyces sp. NBC_00271]
MRAVAIDDGGRMDAETAASVRSHGHEAVVVPASSGGDVLTGEGLAEDLGFVIDDETATETLCCTTANLLSTEAVAGVRHHVALPVRQSRMLFSAIRSTQLCESAGDMADATTEDRAVWAAPADIRPVSYDEVATPVARTACFSPLHGVRLRSLPSSTYQALKAFLPSRTRAYCLSCGAHHEHE